MAHKWIYRHLHAAGVPAGAVQSVLPGGRHWKVAIQCREGVYVATLSHRPTGPRWEMNSRAMIRREVQQRGGVLA